MNIQLLTDIKDCIDGYNPVLVNNGTFDLDVPDNSISSILMIGSIENIGYENLDATLHRLRKLLRLNGKVVISGIDASCISRDLINRTIDCKTYNRVIFSRQSLHDSKELCDKLIALGLQVDKITLKGSTYELHASRSN